MVEISSSGSGEGLTGAHPSRVRAGGYSTDPVAGGPATPLDENVVAREAPLNGPFRATATRSAATRAGFGAR